MSHSYTCFACRVIFEEADTQRAHYKTDWHRYNLKRKVAELPPVTHGEFQVKVEYQTQKKEEKMKDVTKACTYCSKSFSSSNSYENHLKSKKHKDFVEKAEQGKGKRPIEKVSKEKNGRKIKPKAGFLPPVDDDEAEAEDDSDEWEDIDDDEEVCVDDEDDIDEESEALPQTFCLFCPHESVSVVDNFQHMTKSHSFFIPDLHFVTDLEALFVYLGAKVGDGKVCLFCNTHSKQFYNVRAVQNHMVDKGHCMLDDEGDAMLEYADFYDFSSSYPDNEDVSDVDSEISTNESELNIDPVTLELILPSGARAGHRALRKYYNQNISPENPQIRSRAMITAFSTQDKSLLSMNERQLSIAMRKKIVARKSENVHRSRFIVGLGVKANKLQKFFRKQNMYCG